MSAPIPAPAPPPQRTRPWYMDPPDTRPVILVSDFEENPPITVRYIKGDNELDFETVYRNVKNLHRHPGRGLLIIDNEGDPEQDFRMKECDPEFLDAFWTCASNICDYLADFVAFDSVDMQGVWFHLLDKLQEVTILPHYYWISGVPACKHSEDFVRDTNALHGLIAGLINPMGIGRPAKFLGSDYLHPNGGNNGKFGLMHWQQFLYKDSPGFFVPKSKRVYLMASGTTTDHTAFEAHIPRGGLALVDSHTKRLRALTERVVQAESDTPKKASRLAEFDQKALTLNRVSTYTAIDGRQISLHPMYPDPESVRAPRQLHGLIDPTFQTPNPTIPRLNELVGNYKGNGIYHHTDDDEKFQMLSVGAPEALQNRTLPSRVDRTAYSDMYEP